METGASDVAAVIDSLHIARAAFVGWSDGAYEPHPRAQTCCAPLRHAERLSRPRRCRHAHDAYEPNYTAADLAEIRVPVVVAQSEHDEFITREHAEYLAHTIPGALLKI